MIEGANGHPAVELVKSTVPDLILLDLLMPEMDGFEFLDIVRCELGHARVSVIVLTARELTDQDPARLNGCVNRILAKGGLSPSELICHIRSALRVAQSQP